MEKISVQKVIINLLHNGYRFRKVRIMTDGNISYRCVKRNCCARLRVNEKDNIVSSSEHNHEPEIGQNESKKVVSEIHIRDVDKKISLQIPTTVPSGVNNTTDRVEMILIEPRRMEILKERLLDKIITRSDK